jgi:hypothetical protein
MTDTGLRETAGRAAAPSRPARVLGSRPVAVAGAIVVLVLLVAVAGVVVEYRGMQLAASGMGADGAVPPFLDALDRVMLRAGLSTAGGVLGLAGLLPAALLLFGGPRPWVFRSALVLWAVMSAALVAVLWTWTRVPA